MAQAIISMFGPIWSYIIIFILTGIFTSIVVEAINLSFFNIGLNAHPWWIVFIVSLILDGLIIWVFNSLFDNIQEIALMVFVNFFFPILFYSMAGSFTVDLIFKKFKQKAMAVYDEKSSGTIGQ